MTCHECDLCENHLWVVNHLFIILNIVRIFKLFYLVEQIISNIIKTRVTKQLKAWVGVQSAIDTSTVHQEQRFILIPNSFHQIKYFLHCTIIHQT